MREILFRGRTVEGKEWVSGHFAVYASSPFIGALNSYGTMLWFDVDHETIGQYTGLTDKNGKKIFEGDIVATKWGRGVVCYGEFNCSCCDGVFGWYFNGTADIRDYDMYEVIGNIHDNPELLEVEDGK